MEYLILEGLRPWDGRYSLDLQAAEPTYREWGWITRFSGYVPSTVNMNDPRLYPVLALIVLYRAGKITLADVDDIHERFLDAPGSAIVFDSDDVEVGADAVPPPRSSSGKPPTSGPDSPTSSERSDDIPNGSGTGDLATSAFGLATSES